MLGAPEWRASLGARAAPPSSTACGSPNAEKGGRLEPYFSGAPAARRDADVEVGRRRDQPLESRDIVRRVFYTVRGQRRFAGSRDTTRA